MRRAARRALCHTYVLFFEALFAFFLVDFVRHDATTGLHNRPLREPAAELHAAPAGPEADLEGEV